MPGPGSQHEKSMTDTDGGPSPVRRQTLLALLTGFILPVGLYYLLRAAGADPVIALLAGGVPALGRTIYTIARKRTIDKISLFTLCLLAAGAPRR